MRDIFGAVMIEAGFPGFKDPALLVFIGPPRVCYTTPSDSQGEDAVLSLIAYFGHSPRRTVHLKTWYPSRPATRDPSAVTTFQSCKPPDRSEFHEGEQSKNEPLQNL